MPWRRSSPSTCRRCRDSKLPLLAKTEAAVKDRLTKEINYWDHRAEELKLQEAAGKPNARLNSGEARKRADNLQARLQKRLAELEAGGADLAAAARRAGRAAGRPARAARRHDRPAAGRCDARADRRQAGGRRPCPCHRDGGRAQPGLSSPPTASSSSSATTSRAASPAPASCASSRSRAGTATATTITVTKNEILYSLNKPDDFILAIVEFMGDGHQVHYLRRPFTREPDFGVTSVNYDLAELIGRATAP